MICKASPKALQIEYIFCYGYRRVRTFSESCFTDGPSADTHDNMYDLVVIIGDGEEFNDEQAYIRAKEIADPIVRTNIILHRRKAAYTELLEGNFFFSWLFRFAIVLHGKEKISEQTRPEHLRRRPANTYPATYSTVQQLLSKAVSFQNAALNHLEQKDGAKSLRCIQRSITASLEAMLLACTGYQPGKIGLERLLGYTRNFTLEAAAIFPQNTREEDRLFCLLVSVDGTEQTNVLLPVTLSEAHLLIFRAARMSQVAKMLMKERISVLKIPEAAEIN